MSNCNSFSEEIILINKEGKQVHNCPECEKEIEITDEIDILDFVCPFCSLRCELDYENDGLSAHHWFIQKK